MARKNRTVGAGNQTGEIAWKIPSLTVAESRELQTIYRKLAFLLHPDITKSSDERLQELWQQTAAVYKNGDLQTLRTIRLIIGNEKPENEYAENGLNILEILENRQTELKKICENMLDEISELKSTEPFIPHEILDDEAELERRQNFLRDQIADLQEKRLHLTECWAEIMRFAEDREAITAIEEPPNIFEDEDDWAEIIYEWWKKYTGKQKLSDILNLIKPCICNFLHLWKLSVNYLTLSRLLIWKTCYEPKLDR